MKQSNIFVYIELSKMIDALCIDDKSENLKIKLLQLSAYFNIIEPRFFPESLREVWENIIKLAGSKGTKHDEQGRIISSEFTNTITGWTSAECQRLVDSIAGLYGNLKLEFLSPDQESMPQNRTK